MIERAPQDEIDVGRELEAQTLEGERGVPDVGRRRGTTPGTRAFLLSTGIAVVLVGGFLAYKGVTHANVAREEAIKKEQSTVVASALPPIAPSRGPLVEAPPAEAPVPGTTLAGDATQVPALTAAPIPPVAVVGPPGGVATAAQGQRPLTRRQLIRQRQLGSGFGSGLPEGGGGTAQGSPAVASRADADRSGSNEGVAARLSPVRLANSNAGQLGDRNMLVTKGTMIDCGLGTRLDSTVPGLVSCFATRDVWSANGKVVLIQRNSKITGSFSRGLAQGEARLFVTWDRIEEPDGVIINVDSPGTDPLGGSGLPGKVDNHLVQRYGGAVMLSILSDVLQGGFSVLANSVKGSGSGSSTTINPQTTSQTTNDLANTALASTINIPPTLFKNQGDRVNIFVARDMDFSSVYDLKPR